MPLESSILQCCPPSTQLELLLPLHWYHTDWNRRHCHILTEQICHNVLRNIDCPLACHSPDSTGNSSYNQPQMSAPYPYHSSACRGPRLTCWGRWETQPPCCWPQPSRWEVEHSLLAMPGRYDEGQDGCRDPQHPLEPGSKRSLPSTLLRAWSPKSARARGSPGTRYAPRADMLATRPSSFLRSLAHLAKSSWELVAASSARRARISVFIARCALVDGPATAMRVHA
jgi:hypothetical protein